MCMPLSKQREKCFVEIEREALLCGGKKVTCHMHVQNWGISDN